MSVSSAPATVEGVLRSINQTLMHEIQRLDGEVTALKINTLKLKRMNENYERLEHALGVLQQDFQSFANDPHRLLIKAEAERRKSRKMDLSSI